jgi:hypothetical protein
MQLRLWFGLKFTPAEASELVLNREGGGGVGLCGAEVKTFVNLCISSFVQTYCT